MTASASGRGGRSLRSACTARRVSSSPAGLILAGTFAALAQRPLVDLTEVGTAIAIGVLLDTLLVRTVLVPAAFLAIGERAWWPARDRMRERA